MSAKHRDPYWFGIAPFNIYPAVPLLASFFGFVLTKDFPEGLVHLPQVFSDPSHTLQFFAPYNEENDSRAVRMRAILNADEITRQTKDVTEFSALQILTALHDERAALQAYYWPERKTPPHRPRVLLNMLQEKSLGYLPYMTVTRSLMLPKNLNVETPDFKNNVDDFMALIGEEFEAGPKAEMRRKLADDGIEEEMGFLTEIDPALQFVAVHYPLKDFQYYRIFALRAFDAECIAEAPTFRSMCYTMTLLEKYHLAPGLLRNPEILEAQNGMLEMHVSEWEDQRGGRTVVPARDPRLGGFQAPFAN